MDSEDEQCDLETLEALLDDDADEEDPGIKEECETPTTNSDVTAKSVQQFLNAASDCESDDEKDNELDQSELDALASLVAEDSDFDTPGQSVSPSAVAQTTSKSHSPELSASQPTTAHRVSSSAKSKKISSSTREDNHSDKKQKSPKNSSSKHTPQNSPAGARASGSHQRQQRSAASGSPRRHRNSASAPAPKCPAGEDSGQTLAMISPQALQEEMDKMQKKMLELQRLLELQQQQQQQNCGSSRPSPNSKSSPGQKTKPNGDQHQQTATTGKKVPVQNILRSDPHRPQAKTKMPRTRPDKPSTTNQTGALKLMSDDDDRLFTKGQQVPTATESTPKQVKKEVAGRSARKTGGRQNMEKELFGDSDSDWEGLDGEDTKTLSETGRDLRKLLQTGQRKRQAHQSEFNIRDSGSGTSCSWKRPVHEPETDSARRSSSEGNKSDKNVLQCKSSSSDQARAATSVATPETDKFITEDFSKIRIVNPLVSSSLMRMRMEGRKLIHVSRIHLKLKTPDLQGDWVTMAVIVSKTESRSSSTGKPYCIWKLNDLEDLDNSVSFFLFGEVHKQLWKTDIGMVIGVLNPSIMESMDKNKGEPAFTVKSASQVMLMGRSKDLGWCSSVTKKGNKCSKFINKRQGECCAYHVQAAYRKMSATRLELHGSVTGIKPKSFVQKIFAKDCAYVFGGQTYVPYSSGSKSKKGVTLNKLQQAASQRKVHKVNTLSIQDVKPQVSAGSRLASGRVGDDPNDTFMDMITVPTPGSMNLVAHLKQKESSKGEAGSSCRSGRGPAVVKSVTAKDLIKQHKEMMQQRTAQKRKASELLLSSPAAATTTSARPPVDPLQQAPVLGKGFYSGQDISLDVSDHMPRSSADRKKLKALSVIKEKGGLHKEDPNAVKKADVKVTDRVKKRLESESDVQSAKVTKASTGPSTTSREPPAKKSKLLGNVDLNSDEVKNILKARSKHKGALAQAEAEREEVYFTELEKKEMLEEKMRSVTSIEITVVTCRQCLYTAQSAKDSCKREGHTLSRSKAKKRFFMCKKCKHRTFVIGGQFPTEACRKCGAQSFEKTSMYKEKAGPKLDSEVLNLRGDEIKYLNSLDQKVFLNTVIDE